MLTDTTRRTLRVELAGLEGEGLLKHERRMTSPQGGVIDYEGGVASLNLCANNYLGLANDARVVRAAHRALDEWGFGVAAARFIAGTQTIHRDLEDRLSRFLGTDDTILFGSCFDANVGLFEALLTAEDVVISDSLNHASIIDGIRLSKARVLRYDNGDMADLERCLQLAAGARRIMIVTDGVFSMDGYYADLVTICDLAETHGAIVVVDDSHAVGFVGEHGRGTPELLGVTERVDLVTGTLAKALGGAGGGYVTGRREFIALLRQRSRPYLFSCAVPPVIVATALAVIDLIERDPAPRQRLWENTRSFRELITRNGLEVLPGTHPIVPVMYGPEAVAVDAARLLRDRGVHVVAFSYPVVPRGTARIRTQMSAAHTPAELAHAADLFAEVDAEVRSRMQKAGTR